MYSAFVRLNAVVALAAACALTLACMNTLTRPGGLRTALEAVPEGPWPRPLFLAEAILPSALSSYFLAPPLLNDDLGVGFRKVERFHALNRHRVDQAQLLFDVHGDFTSLFDWNTKQLFFYVVVEWETEHEQLPSGQVPNPNQKQHHAVTIWDHIVESSEDAILGFQHQRNKYALIDPEGKLRGKNATMTLRWDTTPIVGWIRRTVAVKKAHFDFPEQYLQNENEVV